MLPKTNGYHPIKMDQIVREQRERVQKAAGKHKQTTPGKEKAAISEK